MADPQLPGIVRVQAIQHSANNMPADDVVNSWAFRNDNYDDSIQFGTTPAQRTALADLLQTFYRALPTLAISQLFTNALTIKGYDLGQPAGVRSGSSWSSPPREPWTESRTLTRPSTGGIMPEEVAIVLTLHGLRSLPRSRGRIYLGPFQHQVCTVEAGQAIVSATARTTILTAMTNLATGAAAAGWTVGIVSQVDQAFVPAVGGWIDNAFDTQRRRGPKATVRQTWSAAGAPAGP